MNRSLFLPFLLLLFAACLKPAAERPPYSGNDDPGLPVNGNLDWLIRQTPAPGNPIRLDTDITIAAFVRTDDSSGNFYDQLILEDSSAGISFRINSKMLYKKYPIGRKVYLKLKGLYLGNDHDLPCLGAAPSPDNAGVAQVSALPARDISKHLIPAGFPAPLPASTLQLDALAGLNRVWLNRLVCIPGMQLVNPGYDRTYAEPESATNIALQDCSGKTILLRNSNYTYFRAFATPSGKGSITAIYSVYDGKPQLLIRDTTDLQFHDPRCDGSKPSVSYPSKIGQVRRIYTGRDTLLSALTITGIVITDAASKNQGPAGSMIVQDTSGGIIIYFGSSATNVPVLGDSIILDLQGSTLTRYNSNLEIKNIRSSAVKVLATGKKVTPISLSIKTLNANFRAYESRLLRIDNARITNPGNYSGGRILTDGSATITLFTSSLATFAQQPAPSITKTFQGIATWYDTVKEIKIRNPELDVY